MADRRIAVNKTIDDESRKLLTILDALEDSGQAIVINGITIELNDAKKKQLIGQLKGETVKTDGAIKAWLTPAVAGIYVDELNNIDNLVKKFGIQTAGGKITVEVLKGVVDLIPHLEAVNSLMSDAYLDFGSGLTGWVKGTEHVLNDIVRQQVQAKIATGRLTGEAIKTITKNVTTVLTESGLKSLIDRGGREWTLQRYGEMLTRTHLIKANTTATINRALEYDIDIMEVSQHGTKDRICLAFEGNIYSLSGKSRNYPQLPQYPPFHPNCRHTLLPRPDLK